MRQRALTATEPTWGRKGKEKSYLRESHICTTALHCVLSPRPAGGTAISRMCPWAVSRAVSAPARVLLMLQLGC